MKTLLVLRHAKSSWASAALDDFDRPLNKRGKRAAPKMGELLIDLDLVPELIICSAAKRAHSTAKLVAKACNYGGEISMSNALYLSGTGAYLRVLREQPKAEDIVLVIGHNPDMENLIQSLTGEYERMPTAALARIELAVDAWANLAFNDEHALRGIWRPKELP